VISSVTAILAAAVTYALFECPILSQTRKLRKRLFPK
jgi:peptidoglycan/LPS O-acetylase OafA/YrhL